MIRTAEATKPNGIAARAIAAAGTGGLLLYDAACRALAEAKSIDEVKDFRSKADAMRAYAKQAENKQLETDAAEIRIRATRRLGELMAAQNEAGLMATGTRGQLNGRDAAGGLKTNPPEERITLAEAGIDKNLANEARTLAAIPETEFDGIVAGWRDRIEQENARVTTNLLKAGEKGLSRQAKEAELAERIRAASLSLGKNVYGVILADPPWRFEPYSRETGMDRAADNHYPTMTLEEIECLNVPAADDCVLFLWATSPMICAALTAMDAWGFKYKSQIIWVKDRIGTGYWARNKHEILLIGTRGNIPAPEPGTQPDSAIVAQVGTHSTKPDVFQEIIEDLYPTLPRLEMFSRRARTGWDAWGAEAPENDIGE